MTRLHLFPAIGGWFLATDNMMPILNNGPGSINLVVNEISKFSSGLVIVYHINSRGNFVAKKWIKFDKENSFDGFDL